MNAAIIGSTGRLGRVIEATLKARGDTLTLWAPGVPVNYLIFAHRYRGIPSFANELMAQVAEPVEMIEHTTWADGDKAVVAVSSIDADEPNIKQSLSYNVSKAALNQAARYLAKSMGIRINTVSPATFTGDNPDVAIQRVADVVAFLCSPEASGIVGENINVRGKPRA